MLFQLPATLPAESGRETTLKAEGEKILLQIAEVVRGDADLSKRRFQVAGHTDAKPRVGGQFKDNWGLSAMRARSVLILLTTPTEQNGGGLSPANWSAAGYADTDPVASNDTDVGRNKIDARRARGSADVAEMLNLQSLTK